jgi:RNase P subunit RPR2
MKTCKACKGKNISVTKDGGFGVRAHCLNCGFILEIKDQTEPVPKKSNEEENK